MTRKAPTEQTCRRTLASLDSYLDNELLTESTLEMHDHLQCCQSCGSEAGKRQAVRERLRVAARSVQVPARLEQRIHQHLLRLL